MRGLEVPEIAAGQLRSVRAVEVARYIASDQAAFVSLVRCRASERLDVLEIEIGLEVAQRSPVDIRSREPFALVFLADRDTRPEFIPLREDFPTDLLHVMSGSVDRLPPSLCVWDVSFKELRGTLTPYRLLADLRNWLERSAEGELHEPDQPLEPVMIGAAGKLILPTHNLDELDGSIVVTVAASEQEGRPFTVRLKGESSNPANNPQFVLLVATAPPMTHRAVPTAPRTFGDLNQVLGELAFDLPSWFRKWFTGRELTDDQKKSDVIMLVAFPKRASDDQDVQRVEFWAFYSNMNVVRLGVALGVLGEVDGEFSAPLIGVDPELNPELVNLQIDPLSVISECEPNDYAKYSGYEHTLNPSIAAIGCGALGSSVILTASRAGFGRWSLIDDDVVLPHNIARHVLGDWAIGHKKAEALAGFVSDVLPSRTEVSALTIDVLEAGEHQEALDGILQEADVIADMSASVPVARYLAEHPAKARRSSLFFNPDGSDAVLLLESGDRSVNLWGLEAAYYTSVALDPGLEGHMRGDDPLVRYGNGCRDRSVTISPASVSVHSGVLTHQLMTALQNEAPVAMVWRHEQEMGTVKKVEIEPCLFASLSLGDWQVEFSKSLIEKLISRRDKRLPCETGGVIMGMVDREYRRIYCTLEIAAPQDSIERPYAFERGTDGLSEEVERIGKATLEQLRYIGEWHSHPNGVAARPSRQDEKLFGGLAAKFSATSEPFIMAILGADELYIQLGENEAQWDGVTKIE